MDDGGLSLPGSTGMDVAFTVFPVVFGLVLVLIIGTIVYRSVRMARRGQNPLTMQEDLAYRAGRSSALAPERTKQQRLDELAALHRDGGISDEELAAARARILAE